MYKIEWKKELSQLAMLALLLGTPCMLYQHLPSHMPIHWNLKGDADHYALKTPVTALMIPLMALATYVLMLLLPYVDPKQKRYSDFLHTYRIIRLALLLFFAGIAAVIYSKAMGINVAVDRTIPGFVGLLIVVIGNFLGKVRQNWFLGIRVPWTLESEIVWNKTHRLGGRLFVSAGIGGIAGVLLPPAARFAALIVPLFLAIAVTVSYSYVIFKKEQKEKTAIP